VPGKANGTTANAYGALYSVDIAVTFPVAFIHNPKVYCQIRAVNGAVSAAPVNGTISPTGFTMRVMGVNNAASLTADYEAHGLI